jgi:hypothetical protein
MDGLDALNGCYVMFPGGIRLFLPSYLAQVENWNLLMFCLFFFLRHPSVIISHEMYHCFS